MAVLSRDMILAHCTMRHVADQDKALSGDGQVCRDVAAVAELPLC